MRIGVLKLNIEIIDSNSLKDRRNVLNSLKERIRRQFNVSISEIDGQDKWQTATLGIACISTDQKFVETMLNKVADYIEEDKRVLLLSTEMEME